jgi:circadian clock protein KaiB
MNDSHSTITQDPEQYLLRLYVAGQTPKSLAAISNLHRMCERHIPNQFSIEVIDLLVYPQLAEDDQIIAIPTLVKKFPEPRRRIIGDLSNEAKVLASLQLKPQAE